MSLTGISGNNIQVREIKSNISADQLKTATSKNGLDEIIVQNSKGKFIIFADALDVKGKFGLPAVGSQVNFGDIQGTVILSDNEWGRTPSHESSQKIKDLCIKTPDDLAEEAKATSDRLAEAAQAAKDKAKAELNEKISGAEKKSELNTNTVSIYGPQVTKEDAEGWLKNNPFLAQSPKLVKLADFKIIDGKVDADELAKIASGGAVVLNGPNSFYLPGEKKADAPVQQAQPSAARQPMTAQEAYYKRKNAEAAADVTIAVGGALLSGINSILR